MARPIAVSHPDILPARRGFSWTAWAMRVLGLIGTWESRIAERRALARLDDRLLCDIGRSRLEALEECAKPFWKP
ncbi:MAG: DUF1127 domain-containing protein [Rhodospirillaceae bacterium]